MFDFSPLFEFSHTHCTVICAVLVPANLLITLQTMIFVRLCHPQVQVQQSAGAAIVYASVMILHVMTWFMIGVTALQTYVLLLLGSLCLAINLWTLTHFSSMNRLFKTIRFSPVKLYE